MRNQPTFFVSLFVAFFLFSSLAYGAGNESARTLMRGMSGQDVKQLQVFLATVPDVYPGGSATGYFGSLTEKAVKRFQQKYGMPSLGIVGPLTRAKMKEYSQTAAESPIPLGKTAVPDFATGMKELGCNDLSSCMTACSKPKNAYKCRILMRSMSGNQLRAGDTAPASSSTPIAPPDNNGNRRVWNSPTEGVGGGILYAENLPSCQGTKLFNAPIAVDGTYDNIAPLGQTSAPGHAFPVDHLYFNFKHTTPGNYASPSLPASILSPGDVEVFQINAIAYEKDGKNIGNDYHLYFAPCREVTGYIGHITALTPKLQNAIAHADQKNCGAPFSLGSLPDAILKPCSYSFLLDLKSGEEIGTAGGPGTMSFLQAFDVGVHDQRIQPLPFVDPKYWTPQNLHTVCGLYYYPDGPVKNNLLNNLKNAKKDANGFPDCGTNMWDKAHTAQGNWVLPHTPTGRVPDMQGFAAIHLNTDPTNQGLIDWGSGIAPAGRIQFSMAESGVINRDPADVKADGLAYCFQDASYGASNVRSVELQLLDDNTLKAEYVNGSCPAPPAFSNPTTYNR